MTTPLHDAGNLKIDEDVHSFLKAEADATGSDLMPHIRNILRAHAQRSLRISNDARTLHQRKGLGDIFEDLK